MRKYANIYLYKKERGIFMQHEITKTQKLLDSNGNIAEPGFAKKLFWQYDRADIKAPKIRIKEWDYYYIGNQDYGLCLTLSY